MPVAAAAILQRIADFLAVGATPQASTEAGDGFSVLLARNTTAPAANQADESGKILPLDRQDLAAETTDLPATGLDPLSETAPAAENAGATTASVDVLPSTAALLIAADPLPRALLTRTAAENLPMRSSEGAPQETQKTAATTDSDVATASITVPVAPIAERPRGSNSIEAHADIDATVPARPVAEAAIDAEHPAKAEKQIATVSTHAHAVVTTEIDTTIASTPVTVETPSPIALPQTIATAQQTETAPREAMPVASPVAPAPATAIEQQASAAIIAASSDAAEIVTPAEVARPSHPVEAKPQVAHRDNHSSSSVKAERQPSRNETAMAPSEASPVDPAPMVEQLATIPPVAPITADAPASPVAAASQLTSDARQSTPIAPTIVAQAPAPLPQAIAPEQLAPKMRPAAHAETAAATSQTNAGQPAAASATAMATPAQPIEVIETSATPAPTTAGVSFVARSTRPMTDGSSTPQPVEAPAPAAKAETVAPLAANGATTPEALPFRTTARQLLAAQPAATETVSVTEAETTVRTPAAEAAPTIAQQLARVSHGGERIIATALPTPTTALSIEQAAALVETIQMLRSEAKSDAMTLAVDHDELGKITMRFDRTDHGVAVRIDSPDAAVTQLIANSAPALRASGDGVGMRFDRQDASGSGSAGTSRDAPRQGAGQDRNPTPYAQSSRPRASGQRDGLFA